MNYHTIHVMLPLEDEEKVTIYDFNQLSSDSAMTPEHPVPILLNCNDLKV